MKISGWSCRLFWGFTTRGRQKVEPPISKICSSNWIISPGRGENKKYLKPPPSYELGEKIEAVFSHRFFGWQIPLQFHLLGIHESKTSSRLSYFLRFFVEVWQRFSGHFMESLHFFRPTNLVLKMAQKRLTFKGGYRKECWKVHIYPKSPRSYGWCWREIRRENPPGIYKTRRK